jgi:peptidoglycan/xylan/chitin deacetylase (PgdA/CDA1 family)
MPKTTHYEYEHSPIIKRPPLHWPNGARVAFWVIPNIEHYPIDVMARTGMRAPLDSLPDIYNHSWRDYGVRIGVWRVMEVLDQYKLRATVALNAAICEEHPLIIEEGERRGWEWMGHGILNAQRLIDLDADGQRQTIQKCVEMIHKATGRAPQGWLGPGLGERWETPALLAEAGFRYVADWVNDDQPYRLQTTAGPLVALPYSIEVNDIPLFLDQKRTGAEFVQIARDQFDTLYREGATSGRVMALALHPFLLGAASRVRYLDEILAYITNHPDVWLATGSEIVEAYLAGA